ncbi:hypothetical protein ACQP1G_03920 [Nocardia sp. CA-107356]
MVVRYAIHNHHMTVDNEKRYNAALPEDVAMAGAPELPHPFLGAAVR